MVWRVTARARLRELGLAKAQQADIKRQMPKVHAVKITFIYDWGWCMAYRLIYVAFGLAILYFEAALLDGYAGLSGLQLLLAPLEACQALGFSLAFGLGLPAWLALGLSALLMLLPVWLLPRRLLRRR